MHRLAAREQPVVERVEVRVRVGRQHLDRLARAAAIDSGFPL